MNIATVVEGPTDRLLIQAVLDHLYPGTHRYFSLQPSTTFGEMGTGWKGVRRWCQQSWQKENSSLEKLLSGATGASLDVLVIHIDADVAEETDLQQGNSRLIENLTQPCPPVLPQIEKLRKVMLAWLNMKDLPPQVILAIPTQDTENWTFAA